MRSKLLTFLFVFSAIGWFLLSRAPARAEPIPKGGFPAAEFLEKRYEGGGQVLTVLDGGNTLVVTHRHATALYDNTDAENPTLIQRIEGFEARALIGTYLYGAIEASDTSWAVWDIQAPLAPVQVGTFTVAGTYMDHGSDYLVFNTTQEFAPGLTIYGLADPTNPEVVSEMDDHFIRWGLVEEDRLYIGIYTVMCDHGVCDAQYLRMGVIDMTDPANPIMIGRGSGGQSQNFYSKIHNGYLYQRNSDYDNADSIVISQISQNPAAVTQIAILDLNGFYPGAITLHENTLYATNGYQTKLYDVTNPAAPSLIATVNESFVGVVYGDYLYRVWEQDPLDAITRYVTIFDVTTPATPTEVTTLFHISGDWAQQGAGNLIYVADRHPGYSSPTYFHTVDTTIPDAPRLVRTDVLAASPYGAPSYAFHIVRDNYLYVTRFAHEGTEDGVDIYRLPTESTPLAFIDTLDVDLRLTAVVNNAFLVQPSDEGQGLQVYDTSNPEAPTLATTLTVEHEGVDGIVTDGAIVYLIDQNYTTGFARIFILDITTPHVPVVASVLDEGVGLPSNPPFMAAANGYLYFAHTDGLGIADVRNPATPIVTVLPQPTLDLTLATFWTDGQRLYLEMTAGACPTALYTYSLENPAMPHRTTATRLAECGPTREIYVPNGDHFYRISDQYGLRDYAFVAARAVFLPSLHRAP